MAYVVAQAAMDAAMMLSPLLREEGSALQDVNAGRGARDCGPSEKWEFCRDSLDLCLLHIGF